MKANPWTIVPAWRGRTDAVGKWISEWPEGICKECGTGFPPGLGRLYCCRKCKRRSKNRANAHARRARKITLKTGSARVKYDIIGKFELLEAFGGRCGICARAVGMDAWIGHITAVERGGQHTRTNIAPVHKECENTWTMDRVAGTSSSEDQSPA